MGKARGKVSLNMQKIIIKIASCLLTNRICPEPTPAAAPLWTASAALASASTCSGSSRRTSASPTTSSGSLTQSGEPWRSVVSDEEHCLGNVNRRYSEYSEVNLLTEWKMEWFDGLTGG